MTPSSANEVMTFSMEMPVTTSCTGGLATTRFTVKTIMTSYLAELDTTRSLYDQVFGGPDNDLIRGDNSKDQTVEGGTEVDTLSFALGATPGFSDSDIPGTYPYSPSLAASTQRGVYVWLGAPSGASTTTAFNGASRFGGGQDTIDATDIEDVVGTPFSDYIVGDGSDNRLYGGGGGDVLIGQDGNDVLHGGADDDHLDGVTGTSDDLNGDGGTDYCVNGDSLAGCDGSATPGAKARSTTSSISVGRMVIPGENAKPFTQAYMAGSDGPDDVAVSYDTSANELKFTRTAGTSAFSSDINGCTNTSSTVITCQISPPQKPLDAILVAGWSGDDSLDMQNIPNSTGVLVLGGDGADTLDGAGEEDVLVDGTGTYDDTLNGLSNSDALLNNSGRDVLSGGDGSDLFISSTTCSDDQLNGGAGVDSSSWATSSAAVAARLYDGTAGAPDGNGAPLCGTSVLLDDLAGVDDLEGSSYDDWLYGDLGSNKIVGRAGVDNLYGREGDDTVLANDGTRDAAINCGVGSNDFGRRDSSDPGIGSGSGSGCEQTDVAPPMYSGDE